MSAATGRFRLHQLCQSGLRSASKPEILLTGFFSTKSKKGDRDENVWIDYGGYRDRSWFVLSTGFNANAAGSAKEQITEIENKMIAVTNQ